MACSRLAGKTALITGAASGIGRESATRFASEGAKVIAVDLNADGLSETAELVSRQGGGSITTFVVDLSDGRACRELANRALASNGRIDVLFNNVGAVAFGTVESTADATLEHLFTTNLKSTFVMSGAIVPAMKERGGSIVITASIAAYVGVRGEAAYAATKGALISLTRCMALDYAAYNIRVNCLCPGLTRTAMVEAVFSEDEIAALVGKKYPLGRIGTAADVAAAALFLASDEAAYITGVTLPVDGGMSAQ